MFWTYAVQYVLDVLDVIKTEASVHDAPALGFREVVRLLEGRIGVV